MEGRKGSNRSLFSGKVGKKLNFLRRDKKRNPSIDLTTVSSSQRSSSTLEVTNANSDHEDLKDHLQESQGSLSRATDVLFHRRREAPTAIEQDVFTAEENPAVTSQNTSSSRSNQDCHQVGVGIVAVESEEEVLEQHIVCAREDPAMLARRQAIEAQKRLFGENHPDVLFALQSLAYQHWNRGECDQAREVLEERERLSSTHMSDHICIDGPIPRDIIIVHHDEPLQF